MKVMVTGGTGFIGSHTVRALVEAGHDVRMLVRSPDKARRVFHDLQCPLPELVSGDILDRESIEACMEGCDALFHAAAVVTMERAKAGEMLHTNTTGTTNVMAAAAARPLTSIVHVSSITVLFNPKAPLIDESSPVARTRSAYGHSKKESEMLVRRCLERGYPVRITYPTAVLGPHDPSLSESNYGIMNFLSRGVPLTSTGFQALDVRDLALIHVRLLEGSGEPGFYPVGGIYKSWRELASFLSDLTGRSIPDFRVPGPILRSAGAVLDLLKRIYPLKSPVTREGMRYVTQWRRVDSQKALEACRVAFRDPAETYGDTIRWLCLKGHITTDQAGRLASGKN